MNMPLLLVGIDPGYKGAIALLDPRVMSLTVYDMPVGKTPTGKEELDLRAMGHILNPGAYERYVAVLEKVHAMPKQGISSAFRFGEGYGAVRMAIIGHGYEDRYVTPQAWKKHFRLCADKGVSRSYAATRFPDYADLFKRVKDDGRAEAALIALYGAEVLSNQPHT